MENDEAKDGVEAVETVKHKRYDIIFIELEMPVMDRFAAAKIILNEIAPPSNIMVL